MCIIDIYVYVKKIVLSLYSFDDFHHVTSRPEIEKSTSYRGSPVPPESSSKITIPPKVHLGNGDMAEQKSRCWPRQKEVNLSPAIRVPVFWIAFFAVLSAERVFPLV